MAERGFYPEVLDAISLTAKNSSAPPMRTTAKGTLPITAEALSLLPGRLMAEDQLQAA